MAGQRIAFERNDCAVVTLTRLSGRTYRECRDYLLQHGYDPATGMNFSAMKLAFDDFLGRKGRYTASRPTLGACIVDGHVMPITRGKVHGHNNEKVMMYIAW